MDRIQRTEETIEEDAQKGGFKPMGDLLPKEPIQKEKPAPHEVAYWVELTAKMLGRSIKQILGLTSGWSIYKIRDRYLYCVKTGNPAKVWWGMRKQDKEKLSTVK